MNSLPRIRPGLLRHQLDGQVLVYDSRDDRVHLLDPTTGCVIELLEEGGWTREGMTLELARRLSIEPDPTFLQLALDQLRASDLLDATAPIPEAVADVTRRDMVRRLALTGAAALLVPAIATLTASPAYAASLGGVGTSCTTNAQCVQNVCCGGLCRDSATCIPNSSHCNTPFFPTINCTCCSGKCDNGPGNSDQCIP